MEFIPVGLRVLGGDDMPAEPFRDLLGSLEIEDVLAELGDGVVGAVGCEGGVGEVGADAAEEAVDAVPHDRRCDDEEEDEDSTGGVWVSVRNPLRDLKRIQLSLLLSLLRGSAGWVTVCAVVRRAAAGFGFGRNRGSLHEEDEVERR
jgi:hypothetical protein